MNSQPIGSHFCQQTDMFLHFTCSLERRNNQSQNSSFWNDIKPRFSCMVQLGSILVPGTFLNLVFRSRQCRRDSDTAVISSWSDTATGIMEAIKGMTGVLDPRYVAVCHSNKTNIWQRTITCVVMGFGGPNKMSCSLAKNYAFSHNLTVLITMFID